MASRCRVSFDTRRGGGLVVFITYVINKVRSRFNVRSIWFINRAIGIIIIVMSVFGFVWGIKDYILH